MANTIKRSDISEADVFGDVRDSAHKTIQEIEELNTELNETARILKNDISKAKFVDTASINKATKNFEKANKVKKTALELQKQKAQAIKIEQNAEVQLERIKREKLKTESQEIRNKQQLAREQERINKGHAKAKKAIADESNAYKRLVKSTRDQKNESKRLAVELINLEQAGKRNSKEFRKLSSEYKRVTKSARNGDQSLKKIDKTVGDNFRNVGNYTGALNKLKSGLGGLGLAFGAFSILKSAGQTVVEFDKQVKSLVSITGASGEDLEFFKEQARTLGTEVEGGASGVIEAYKLIGSAKPELLKNAEALDELTQKAITLSQASGLDLPDAATRLTDALNQFGAPADQAGRFIDVLANASLEGSAAIPDVTDALLKFGAVAKTSNVSVEESAALIETLASKGLKGAEAGTALRNVMLKLSAPDALPKEAQERMKELGISFEDISDPSRSFADRLESMKPLLSDNTALQKVFGKENAVAAINLISLTDETKELTKAMGNQGTASKQASENTDTIAFAFNKLKESWNELILRFNEGSGIGDMVKNLFLGIANNLQLILGLLGKAVVAWGFYKAILIATQTKNFLMNGGLQDTIKSLGSTVKGLFKMKKAGKGAGEGMRAMGKGMKSIPFVAIIAVVVELATAIWDLASGTAETARQTENLAKAQEQGAAQAKIVDEDVAKRLKDRFKAIDLLAAKNDLSSKQVAQMKRDEVEASKRDVQRVQGRLQDIKKESDAYKESAKIRIEELKKIRNANNLSVKEGGSVGNLKKARKATDDLRLVNNELERQTLRGATASAALTDLDTTLEGLIDSSDAYTTEIVREETNMKKARQETARSSKAHKELNTNFSDQIELLKELNEQYDDYIDIQNDIRDLDQQSEISDLEIDIEAELEAQRRKAEATGEIDVDLLETLIARKQEIQKQAILDEELFEIQAEERSFQRRFSNMEQKLEDERTKLLSQANLTEAQIAEIESGYEREKADLDSLKLDAKKNLDLKIVAIHKETNQELKSIDRETAEEVKNVNDELIQEQINFSQADKKLKDDEAKAALDKEKANAATRKEIAQAVTDFMKKQSEERIALLDDEISKAEKESQRLQELADNGNIKAEQSLAEQNRIIAEAEQKKNQEKQAQARRDLVNVGIQTYNSKIEQGEDNPLAATIRDIALLQQFLSTIPAFYEGTDTTVASALGAPDVSGRDGYVVRVDGREKVLNPTLSDMTGAMTTNEIAHLSQDYLNGKMIHKGEGAVQIASGWQTSAVINKLDSLERTIQNKPETSYNFEQLSDKLFAVLKTQKKGNTLIHNKYRKDT